MKEIVGIRFKKQGKIYFFDPDKNKFKKGEHAIVETARGIELGEVAFGNKLIDEEKLVNALKKVVRIATPEDVRRYEENEKHAKHAYDFCLKKINEHGLDMKLIDVEYTFDNSKLLFYFTSDGRVDFRELVKDLAAVYKTRIELRQIGVRDEVKMIGGYGMCGRELCCCSYLSDINPVTIKMAKEQGLSLNPTKISGACGRLMCCLKYEQEVYEEKLSKLPNVGALVKTPDGNGVVENVEVLRESVSVRIESGEDVVRKSFLISEIEILRNSKKKDDDADINELKNLEDN